MGFFRPELLLLLVLMLPVWWLHRRRRVLQRVSVHAPFLLPRGARLERGGRQGWQGWLHLLLRLTLVALLALALAGPWLAGRGPERMVLVVPRGLEMALPLPDGRTRFLAALDDGAAALRAASPRRALVLLAGAEPEAASSWLPPEEALAAARELPPGLGLPALKPALREARRLAGPEGAVALGRAPLKAVSGNRSLLGLTFTPHGSELERGLLGVRLRTWQWPGKIRLRLDSSAGPITEVELEMPSSGEALASVNYKGPGGVALRAHLPGQDSFAADDEAWIRLPPLGARKVALITPGNPELVRALSSLPRVRLELLPPGSRPASAEAELVILDRERLLPQDLADPAGPPLVLVTPRRDSVPAAAAGSPTAVTVSAGETRPGVLSLSGLLPGQLGALPPPPGEDAVLARQGSQAVLWTAQSGRVRLALAFDPGAGGLGGSALHAALWDDLLTPLLLPPEGGCRPVPVGSRLEGALLERPGIYQLPDGQCAVGRLPLAEALDGLPDPEQETGIGDLGEVGDLLGIDALGEAAGSGEGAGTGDELGEIVDVEALEAQAGESAAPTAEVPPDAPPLHRRPLTAELCVLLLLLLAGERVLSCRSRRTVAGGQP